MFQNMDEWTPWIIIGVTCAIVQSRQGDIDTPCLCCNSWWFGLIFEYFKCFGCSRISDTDSFWGTSRRGLKQCEGGECLSPLTNAVVVNGSRAEAMFLSILATREALPQTYNHFVTHKSVLWSIVIHPQFLDTKTDQNFFFKCCFYLFVGWLVCTPSTCTKILKYSVTVLARRRKTMSLGCRHMSMS